VPKTSLAFFGCTLSINGVTSYEDAARKVIQHIVAAYFVCDNILAKEGMKETIDDAETQSYSGVSSNFSEILLIPAVTSVSEDYSGRMSAEPEHAF